MRYDLIYTLSGVLEDGKLMKLNTSREAESLDEAINCFNKMYSNRFVVLEDETRIKCMEELLNA